MKEGLIKTLIFIWIAMRRIRLWGRLRTQVRLRLRNRRNWKTNIMEDTMM